jgi:structural maintenance of chromosome 4
MLDRAQEERTEKLNRARLAAKEKGGLEQAKCEAEEYLTKDREILRRKAIVAQMQRLGCERAVEGATRRRDELAEKLRAERERLADGERRLRDAETAVKRMAKDGERTAAEVARTKADFAAFQR